MRPRLPVSITALVLASAASLAGCGGSGGGSTTTALSANSTCADLNNGDVNATTRIVRAQLAANNRSLSSGSVANALGSVTYACSTNPDKSLSSFSWAQLGSGDGGQAAGASMPSIPLLAESSYPKESQQDDPMTIVQNVGEYFQLGFCYAPHPEAIDRKFARTDNLLYATYRSFLSKGFKAVCLEDIPTIMSSTEGVSALPNGQGTGPSRSITWTSSVLVNGIEPRITQHWQMMLVWTGVRWVETRATTDAFHQSPWLGY